MRDARLKTAPARESSTARGRTILANETGGAEVEVS
jgi:hypothetical protein